MPETSIIAELKDLDELAALRTSKQNIIFDFYAPWCVPCKAVSKALEDMTLELQSYSAHVVRINVDLFQAAATMYNVRSLPTLLFSKQVDSSGSPEIVGTYVGVLTKSQIQQSLAKHF
jgi:thioredoxin 1